MRQKGRFNASNASECRERIKKAAKTLGALYYYSGSNSALTAAAYLTNAVHEAALTSIVKDADVKRWFDSVKETNDRIPEVKDSLDMDDAALLVSKGLFKVKGVEFLPAEIGETGVKTKVKVSLESTDKLKIKPCKCVGIIKGLTDTREG